MQMISAAVRVEVSNTRQSLQRFGDTLVYCCHCTNERTGFIEILPWGIAFTRFSTPNRGYSGDKICEVCQIPVGVRTSSPFWHYHFSHPLKSLELRLREP